MRDLDDPFWRYLTGEYDLAQRLKDFAGGFVGPEQVWEELWEELHHQGDVTVASYAAVPHIVRICIERNIFDWNPFALVATIEECRVFKAHLNPSLPAWLENDYYTAIQRFALFGASHFAETWAE